MPAGKSEMAVAWAIFREIIFQGAETLVPAMTHPCGFESKQLHTSGHASVADIERVSRALAPHMLIPIHTITPYALGNRAQCQRAVRRRIQPVIP